MHKKIDLWLRESTQKSCMSNSDFDLEIHYKVKSQFKYTEDYNLHSRFDIYIIYSFVA